MHEVFVRWLEIRTVIEHGEDGVRRYFMGAVMKQRSKMVRREGYFDRYRKYRQDREKSWTDFVYPDDSKPCLYSLLDQISVEDQDILFHHFKHHQRLGSARFIFNSLPAENRITTQSGLNTRAHRAKVKLMALAST